MSLVRIRFPKGDVESATREVTELTRRWGMGSIRDSSPLAAGEYLEFGDESHRVQIPHHGLSGDFARWHAETSAMLAVLPHPEVLLADTEGAVSSLFDEPAPGSIVCPFDLPGILYGLLTRREELLSDARDEHGRWQPESSLLHEWLDVPVVDLLARGFGAMVARVLGIAPPEADPPWSIAMTFDIDFAGPNIRSVPREAVRSMRSRGPFSAAVTAGRSLACAVIPRADPILDFDTLADRLEDNGLRGLFFAQSLHRSRWDDYELNREPGLIRALRRLRTRGHHIGLHGSYATADHGPQLLKLQRERLASTAGGPVDRYRAHYLRTRTPEVEKRCLVPAGIEEDWSIGYSNREGFRLGTAHLVRTPSGVLLQPLHLMDVTLRFHRAYSPEVALMAGIRLLSRVKAVGGTATILWHPHNMGGPLWPDPWPEVPWELALWARENGARDALA